MILEVFGVLVKNDGQRLKAVKNREVSNPRVQNRESDVNADELLGIYEVSSVILVYDFPIGSVMDEHY